MEVVVKYNLIVGMNGRQYKIISPELNVVLSEGSQLEAAMEIAKKELTHRLSTYTKENGIHLKPMLLSQVMEKIKGVGIALCQVSIPICEIYGDIVKINVTLPTQLIDRIDEVVRKDAISNR